METNENSSPTVKTIEFSGSMPDTECGIYIPAQCEPCGHKNSENCNTCPVLNPETRGKQNP
jgi:hypothetical protein